MTRNELLLNLAIEALNWPDRSQFKTSTLIHEGDHDYPSAIRRHFPDVVAAHRDPDVDDEGYISSAATDEVIKLATAYLRELRAPHECPAYRAERQAQADSVRVFLDRKAAERRELVDRLIPLEGRRVRLTDNRGTRVYTLQLANARGAVDLPGPDVLQVNPEGFGSESHIFRCAEGQFSTFMVKSIVEDQ